MNSYIQGFLALRWLVLMLVLAFGSSHAYAAVSVSDAMTTVTSNGGTFNNGDHKIFSGPSLRMFTGTSSINLFSITPPTLRAGCNGIDFNLGGFSYINGDRLVQFAKQIMQNAKGYAAKLAIRTLCPICAELLQTLEDLANWANALMMNSCAVATGLLDAAANFGGENSALSLGKGFGESLGLGATSDNGGSNDNLLAKGMSAVRTWTEDQVKNVSSQCQAEQGGEYAEGAQDNSGAWYSHLISSSSLVFAKIAANDWDYTTGLVRECDLKASLQTINQTWAKMLAFGITDRYVAELLQSAVGTSYVEFGTASIINKMEPGWPHPSKTLLRLLLLGNAASPAVTLPAGATPEAVDAKVTFDKFVEGVKREMDLTNLKYLQCTSGLLGSTVSLRNLSDCNAISAINLTSVSSSMNPLITGDGLLTRVLNLMLSAYNSVLADQPLSADVINLFSNAPVPVYRALKIAVVSPSAGRDVIAQQSYIIALMMAEDMLRNWLYTINKSSNLPATEFVAWQEESSAMISEFYSYIGTVKGVAFADLSYQQAMWSQIKLVEHVIAERVTNQGLGGNMLFGRMASKMGSQVKF